MDFEMINDGEVENVIKKTRIRSLLAGHSQNSFANTAEQEIELYCDCSHVGKIRKVNHRHILKTTEKSNNRNVFRIRCPKCPDRPIGTKLAIEKLVSKFIFLSEFVNARRFGCGRAKISPPKHSGRLANGPSLKIPDSQMTSSTPAAPAIPHEYLLSWLREYCFTEQMLRALERQPDFAEVQFRAHQICFVQDFPQRKANHTLSVHQLSKAFECQPGRVKAALANGLKPPKMRGHQNLPSMTIRKQKFWTGSKGKQKSLVLLREPIFATIVKQNIPLQSAEDGWIPLFCVTRTFEQKLKVCLEKKHDWKYLMFSWTKLYDV
jgi:hypothetical protein